MDLTIAIVLGAALGTIPPYLGRTIVPWLGFAVLLVAAIWYCISTLDGSAGLPFGLAAVIVASGITWLRDRRSKRSAADDAPRTQQSSHADTSIS